MAWQFSLTEGAITVSLLPPHTQATLGDLGFKIGDILVVAAEVYPDIADDKAAPAKGDGADEQALRSPRDEPVREPSERTPERG